MCFVKLSTSSRVGEEVTCCACSCAGGRFDWNVLCLFRSDLDSMSLTRKLNSRARVEIISTDNAKTNDDKLKDVNCEFVRCFWRHNFVTTSSRHSSSTTPRASSKLPASCADHMTLRWGGGGRVFGRGGGGCSFAEVFLLFLFTHLTDDFATPLELTVTLSNRPNHSSVVTSTTTQTLTRVTTSPSRFALPPSRPQHSPLLVPPTIIRRVLREDEFIVPNLFIGSLVSRLKFSASFLCKLHGFDVFVFQHFADVTKRPDRFPTSLHRAWSRDAMTPAFALHCFCYRLKQEGERFRTCAHVCVVVT